jgi:hypothetical protein|uniref:Uncharacterized protein n=1 Tax=Siphoviridae sp. ctHip2 TaxID=2827830 RepID=A0A8S5RW80_9CAUD|nr:MAG TPA: hypothetical protein [Siphoviridae sp. ctHip2]
MKMNYITDNQELEEFENYLKILSNELQTKYKEDGKYLYMRTVTRVITAILYPIVFVFLFLYLLAFMQPLSAITNILLIILDISLFIASVNFTTSYIIPRFKLPIVSKKSFLKQNKSLLITKLNNYNLNLDDVIIDSKNLEISLNKDDHKSMKKLKMLKRAQKIGGQND